jgi:hypothetical protein
MMNGGVSEQERGYDAGERVPAYAKAPHRSALRAKADASEPTRAERGGRAPRASVSGSPTGKAPRSD